MHIMLSMLSCRVYFLLLVLVGVVYCYPSFQRMIPNGESVPHPCNPNYMWKGVGHNNRGGGGERNSFGLDFDTNGKVWNRTLCMKDSDGDGKTNGQELGDPDCTWSPGHSPRFVAGLSHPGVCEPMDSAKCRRQASFVQCDNMEFECDAVDQPGVSNFTVRFPSTKVPPTETTYMCMGFEFPNDTAYHMVANEPIIDNINVMHHIIIYGCGAEAPKADIEMGKPFNCFMSGREGCNDMIGLWAVGSRGQCFHPDTGFLVGNNPKGYNWGIFEMHWNNPTEDDTWYDSSGMTFHLTINLRPYNAGVLMIGQLSLEIPPGEERYTASSRVGSSCTKQIMTGPVSIVGALNHMHYLGDGAVTTLLVPGESSTSLAYDPKYSYDSPVFYDHANPIRMNPGDELDLQCHFKSTSRTKTTYYGESTYAEMCFAFIIYYPKENIPFSALISYRDIDACDFRQPVIKGCNTTEISDNSNPENIARYTAVSENCAIGYCKDDCKAVVKRIKQHPCYQGSIKQLQLDQLESIQDINDKYGAMRFWAGLESCNEELLREHLLNDLKFDNGESNDAESISHSSSLMTSALVSLMSILACMLFF